MFKRAVLLTLFVGVMSLVNAGDDTREISEESVGFIGVEVGGAWIQGETGGFFGEANHKGSGASLGVKLGAQNEQWKSSVIIDYFNSDDDDQTYERAMVQVDYFIAPTTFATPTFRPYIGLNGGYLNYESTGVNESGMTYGGDIGFSVGVGDSVDLDLTYRYSIAGPEEFDNIHNVVVGINYLY